MIVFRILVVETEYNCTGCSDGSKAVVFTEDCDVLCIYEVVVSICPLPAVNIIPRNGQVNV